MTDWERHINTAINDLTDEQDRRIAELEAEVERLRNSYGYEKKQRQAWTKLCEEKMAELERLNGRRCGTCRWWNEARLDDWGGCENPALCYPPRCFDTPMGSAFGCIRWEARYD